ncbi:MAG: hypothetical protein JOZ89_02590, partial [Gammaproteobacteria bacterium]|nr:hypothetical protein [Gammaproteobacteria bacterium]
MPLRLLLRQQRVGLIAMTYFGIAYTLINSAGYPYFAGKTAAAQVAFGSQMQVLAAQIVWLLPQPLHPGTVAGYVQWRAYGFLAIVFPVWALLSAAGASRGDEGRGLVETWLASGVARGRYLITRCGVFAAASALTIALAGLAAWIGGLIAGAPLDPLAITQTSLSLWALTIACYAIALLVGQQATTFRGAAGLAGVALLVLFLLDSLRKTSASPRAITNISVFSLNDRTNAIAPGGSFDGAAVAILLLVAAVAAAAALQAFRRRDIHAALVAIR